MRLDSGISILAALCSTLSHCKPWHSTGVLCSEETAPPLHPTVGLRPGPYGGLRGGCCFLSARYPCIACRGALRNAGMRCPFGSLRSTQRALPTGIKVESGTPQSKRGTFVNLSHSGEPFNIARGTSLP